MLVKLRLTLTVVFSSVMAFLIASSGPINWLAVVILSLGGLLVTGAANTLNQVLEKDYDSLMQRTADRPLAAGRMKISEAVLAAGLMSLFGITLLALFNPWTAFLGTISLTAYAFLYTPIKRLSPAAVMVGAVPGALPVMIGCVAAQGELTLLAWSLFAVQFFWQFPHFWSIGYLGFADYQKAGYKLMPSRNGQPDPDVGRQAFLYTLLLLPAGALPYVLGVSGMVSLVFVLSISVVFMLAGWKFYRAYDRSSALRLMFFSFGYIPFTLIAFWLDKI